MAYRHNGTKGPPMTITTEFLTVREVAERLRIAPSTLATWRLKGEGPSYVRMSNRVRYAAAAVDAYVAECTVVPSS